MKVSLWCSKRQKEIMTWLLKIIHKPHWDQFHVGTIVLFHHTEGSVHLLTKLANVIAQQKTALTFTSYAVTQQWCLFSSNHFLKPNSRWAEGSSCDGREALVRHTHISLLSLLQVMCLLTPDPVASPYWCYTAPTVYVLIGFCRLVVVVTS